MQKRVKYAWTRNALAHHSDLFRAGHLRRRQSAEEGDTDGRSGKRGRAKRKILLISKALPSNFKGGIQTHVWELSGALIGLGYEVSILTAGNFRRGAIWRPREGRMIIAIPYFPGRYFPLLQNLIEENSFNLMANWWLRRHGHKFDVIHVQGRSGLLFPGELRKRSVLTIHRLFSVERRWNHDEYRNGFDRRLHGWITNWLERRCLRRVAAAICVSQCTINEVQESIGPGAPQLDLIYNGVSFPPEPATPTAVNPSQLLFVGRLADIKGVFPLMIAMKAIRSDIKLVMVGEGPARKDLEDCIRDLKLKDRVSLIGAREHAEVFQLIRESYALILPSFHESQGIVLMESNICGRPVLAANVGGAREVVIDGKNGLLFPPGEPEAIAEKVNQIFACPRQAAAMGAWGRRFVRQYFNWAGIARATAKVYARLC